MGYDKCFFLYVLYLEMLWILQHLLWWEPIPVDSTILSHSLVYIQNLDCVTCDWILVGMALQTSCLIVS